MAPVARSIALVLGLVGAAHAQPKNTYGGKYKPGWNGEAKVPPQGWRSWNAFGAGITQDMMMQAVDAMTAKNRTVAGWDGKVSLCDLGTVAHQENCRGRALLCVCVARSKVTSNIMLAV